MSTGSLILAVPSKGRLKTQFDAFMARADMPLSLGGNDRGYAGRIQGLEGLEVRFLSASEIARDLLKGTVHLGVTGRDLVDEINASKMSLDPSARVTPLGFGKARVIVAVPKGWVDVVTMADLRDVASLLHQKRGTQMRVATKYIHLSRQFFSKHGVNEYRLVESLGATEGAPKAGSADLIVDITSTGSTLEANDLRILRDGEILQSEAFLFASLKRSFSNLQRVVLRQLLDRMEAKVKGESVREIRTCLPPNITVTEELSRRFDITFPWPAVRLDDGTRLVTLHGRVEQVTELVQYLKENQAGPITVNPISDLYAPDSKLYASLAPRLNLEE